MNKILGAIALATTTLSGLAVAAPAEARGGYYDRGYSEYRPGDYYRDGYRDDRRDYRRDYRDDRRYYRDQRRNYRDNRYSNYRCRDNGTGGTVIGAIVGGLLGNEVVGRRGDKTAGVILGGAAGALAGRAIDRNC
ncbi:MAG: glycine zipper 2TM domain-containing protein [Parasphingorhabdus sp.]|nr:glycine zipper 2TM domain-containing protein [Parasphingorhabdus sp.]